jgi:hypothetical protein
VIKCIRAHRQTSERGNCGTPAGRRLPRPPGPRPHPVLEHHIGYPPSRLRPHRPALTLGLFEETHGERKPPVWYWWQQYKAAGSLRDGARCLRRNKSWPFGRAFVVPFTGQLSATDTWLPRYVFAHHPLVNRAASKTDPRLLLLLRAVGQLDIASPGSSREIGTCLQPPISAVSAGIKHPKFCRFCRPAVAATWAETR